MLRIISALVSLSLLLGDGAVDFSGVWRTDPARSESAHQDTPVGPITLDISQTPQSISIETKTSEKDRPLVANEKLVYRLDGNPNRVTANGVEVTCTARWKGDVLVLETLRNLNESTVATHWELRMNPNGKEISIRKSLTVQHGYQAPGPANNVGVATDVFRKVGTAAGK